MTREEVINIAKGLLTDFKVESDTMVDFCNTVIALAQEPCEDAISRQEAINTIDALYLDGDSCASYRADAKGDCLIGKYQAITALDDLPSVTPQQKMGKWIHFAQSDDCSECRWSTGKYISPSKYCPNCGAKMVDLQESEDKE